MKFCKCTNRIWNHPVREDVPNNHKHGQSYCRKDHSCREDSNPPCPPCPPGVLPCPPGVLPCPPELMLPCPPMPCPPMPCPPGMIPPCLDFGCCDGAFGQLNSGGLLVLSVTETPAPLRLSEIGPLHNIGATPGTLTTICPGTYELSYNLTPLFDTELPPRPDLGQRQLLEQLRARLSSRGTVLPPDLLAFLAAGVLVNGVPLESSISQLTDSGQPMNSLHSSVLAELPANAHLSLGLWLGPLTSYYSPVVVLQQAQLQAKLL